MECKVKWLLLAVLLLSCMAGAQNVRVDNVAFSSLLPPNSPFISQPLITVCTSAGAGLPCNTPVSGLCISATDTVCNSPAQFTGDNLGNFGFWIQPGRYVVTVTKAGFAGSSTSYTLACQSATNCTTTGNNTHSGTETFNNGLSANSATITALTAATLISNCVVDGTTHTTIQSCLNALSPGGTVILPNGTYTTDTYPLTITKPVHIVGSGMPDASDVQNGTLTNSPCIIKVPAATVGIQVTTTAYQVVIENCWLRGSSTVLGTDDGIQVRAHTILRNVVVSNFGRDGVNVDTSVSGNANLSEFDNVWSTQNKRRGFYLHGTNSNKINVIDTSATLNTDRGYYTDSNQNVFVGAHADSNAGGAIYENGIGNDYYSPYVEQGGVSNAVLFDTSAVGAFYKSKTGATGTITNSSAAGSENQIMYTGTSNLQTWNGLRIQPVDPQAASPVVYSLDSGRQATSTFSLRDDTNATTFAQYNVSGRWQFLQNAGWANGATAQIYNGISTAGQGIVPIYGATSQKAETGTADANVLTFTPPATVGTYRACVTISVSSATAGVISWTLNWTDSNGNAQSNVAMPLFQFGTAAPNTTFTTSAAGNYSGCSTIDVNNAAASIIAKWVGGGTTAAKVSATVERLQ